MGLIADANNREGHRHSENLFLFISFFLLLIADANNREGHRNSENSFLLISFDILTLFHPKSY